MASLIGFFSFSFPSAQGILQPNILFQVCYFQGMGRKARARLLTRNYLESLLSGLQVDMRANILGLHYLMCS